MLFPITDLRLVNFTVQYILKHLDSFWFVDQVPLNVKCRVKTQSASRISSVSNLATINIHRHTYKVTIFPK